MNKFQKELEGLINPHCIENECDMPDFLLAEMIVSSPKQLDNLLRKIQTGIAVFQSATQKYNQSLQWTQKPCG